MAYSLREHVWEIYSVRPLKIVIAKKRKNKGETGKTTTNIILTCV